MGLDKMKRFLAIVLVLALASAAFIAVQRLGIEQQNKTVELVVDFHAFSQFTGDSFPAAAMLEDLKQLGIESAAVREWTLGERTAFGHAGPDFSLYKPADWPLLLAEPVGFNPEEIDLIVTAGMRPVLRLAPNQLLPLTVQEKLSGLTPHLVIPVGDGADGFPDRLGEVKVTLAAAGARIGIVEFMPPKGISQVASADTGIRVHEITGREMAVLTKDRALSRYLRAVRERNVRILYIHPFPGENGWELTAAMLTELSSMLTANGFQIGAAAPYPEWQPSRFQLWIVSLGILAGAGLLCLFWVRIPDKLLTALFLLASALGGGLLLVDTLFMQQVFALMAAIVFPVLAVAGCGQGRRVAWTYLKCTLWSAAGLVLIIGILSGTPFLIKLVEFRGVKLMHLAPVALVFVMGLLGDELPLSSYQQAKRIASRYYHASVPVKYLLCLAFAAMVGAVYLLRTANFVLPIPQLELAVREGLERLLLVRPRFKEILIGHPALVALLASRKRHPLLMSLAVIGQLSLVNTFTHIHTPIIISVLRTVCGLIIGYAVGLLVWAGYQRLKRRMADDSRFRILRLP